MGERTGAGVGRAEARVLGAAASGVVKAFKIWSGKATVPRL